MVAERLAALVAVEERREHAQRQRRGQEQRVAGERLADHVAELARHGMILRQLLVVLDLHRLVPGRDAPVYPFRRVQLAARMRHLLGGEDVGNLNQHDRRISNARAA